MTQSEVSEGAQRRVRTPGDVVHDWWRALHPRENGSGGDRATLAQLRRARSLNEVLTIPATISLWGQVGRILGHPPGEGQTAALAILAGVLANVDPGPRTRTSLAEALGQNADGKRRESESEARLSPLRFAALMRAADDEERLRTLRRATAMLKGAPFDVVRFANDLLHWSDDRRRRWIFDYYQFGDVAPAQSDTEEDVST